MTTTDQTATAVPISDEPLEICVVLDAQTHPQVYRLRPGALFVVERCETTSDGENVEAHVLLREVGR